MKMIRKCMNAFIVFGMLAFVSLAHAEVGHVVFSYGVVTATSTDGTVRRLFKRGLVEEGDTIKTSSNSMVQLRMIDKAIIALRSNSEVTIENFNLGATKEEDVGIFSLLKGGFRAVTGIIGKRFREAYKMRTPTATIGIRGTDYTARLCNDDCSGSFSDLASAGSIENGLYVGVNEGGIHLTNELGTLDLNELQFGYVKDATTAPVALLSAPEFLYFNSKAPNPDEQTDESGAEATQSPSANSPKARVVASRAEVEPESLDLNTDDTIRRDLNVEKVEIVQEQIEQNTATEQVAVTSGGTSFSLADGVIDSSRQVAVSYGKQATAGSFTDVSSNPYGTAQVDANHNMTQFEHGFIGEVGTGVYSADSSTTIDLGFDPDTGIAWGRWAEGQTQFQVNGVVQDTSQLSSVHWVVSPDQSQAIALPSIGTATYDLVGNTTPTDNSGNSGILGNATLHADFSNMTVDTSVAVGINNQVWNANADNLAIGQNGGFAGAMNSVSVEAGNTTVTGTGNTAGFFTNNATGAGLGFSLEANINGEDTTVTGTAVFQK